MADVFISFKSEEQDHARRVAQALEAEGLSVWWATHLASGQTYPAEIERQLRSAAVVVVLWSPAAAESLWVRAEATLALDRKVLMPAQILPCAVPLPFNVLQTVDLTQWQGESGHSGWRGFARAIAARAAETKRQTATPEMKAEPAPDLEAIYWSTIESGNDRSGYESYLVRYPEGRFARLAQRRLEPEMAGWSRKGALTLAGTALVGSMAWFVAQRIPSESPAQPPASAAASAPASQASQAETASAPPAATIASAPRKSPPPKPTPKPSEPAPDPQPPVALAPTRATVPDIRGQDPDQAAQRLTEARLTEGRRFALTARNATPGQVYRQQPDPGAQVLRGTAVDLWIARVRAPGVQHAGHVPLVNTQVVDLDGVSTGREGHDIRLDAVDAVDAKSRRLEPLAPARLAPASRSTVRPADCASAAFSQESQRLHVGLRICVLTNESRLSLIRVVDLGEEVTIDFETAQAQQAPGTPEAGLRSLTLRDKDSPNLASGTTHSLTGGDFYLTIDKRTGAASFLANNQDQRGLVDLGSLPGQSLRSLVPPVAGYYQFGVPVVEGHVYVARALESGRHIVMRVRSLNREGVTLELVYK